MINDGIQQQEIPQDALSMPIADIERAMGQLTMHNIALQAEIARLKQRITVLESGVRGN